MRKVRFIQNNIYHIYNRGVEKRNIFMDNSDYFRFIHDLYEFNDKNPAFNIYYKTPLQSYEAKPRKLLVEILAFVLMPNHFHLLLKEISENGISNFMHKLGGGYTMSFNQKYERSGSLFQGSFKAVLINQDSHFIHLPYYIHLNPLDLIMPEWRTRAINDYKKAMEFLENYRWSSHLDYIGKQNFPSVTHREFLLDFFGGQEEYRKVIFQWLKDIDLEEIKPIMLEK